MIETKKSVRVANAHRFGPLGQTSLLIALMFCVSAECNSAQLATDSKPAHVSEGAEKDTTENGKLAKYPVPSRKDVHPKGWYDSWPNEVARIEKLFADKNTSSRIKTMEHWNRFLCYFKMVPDDSSQILDVFMEAYRNDRHYFCAEYAEWIPRLTSGEFIYCLEMYESEKPVMDEIVRLVMESYDQQLVKQLTEIKKLDQSLRGSISKEAKAEDVSRILAEQRKLDLENLKAVEEIIAKHGYPGRSLVGIELEKVAFLVIQHSGGDVIGKYLPLIKEAINNQDLAPNVYPYLFDRFEVSNGRPQHFGTQTKLDSKELFPLYDSENLNSRRRKYGLRPLFIENEQ